MLINKRVSCLLLLIYLCLPLLAYGEEDAASPIISDEAAAQIKEQFIKEPPRLFLYSKPFAERFGLDVEKAIEMDERLFAVKLEIKQAKMDPVYPSKSDEIFNCHFSVYLDSNLEVAYPITPFAHAREYANTRHIIEDDLPNLTDEQFHELGRYQFFNHARVATDNWVYGQLDKEIMYVGGLTYIKILVNAFKGVTYVKFMPTNCSYYYFTEGHDWNLWLQKTKEGDFFDLLHRYHDDWPTFKAQHEIIPLPKIVMEFPESKLAEQFNLHLSVTTSIYKKWILENW